MKQCQKYYGYVSNHSYIKQLMKNKWQIIPNWTENQEEQRDPNPKLIKLDRHRHSVYSPIDIL